VGPIQPRRKVQGIVKEEDDDIEVKLEDPTSVSLMNSFLIKNAGSSFEGISLKEMKMQRKQRSLETSGTMTATNLMQHSNSLHGA